MLIQVNQPSFAMANCNASAIATGVKQMMRNCFIAPQLTVHFGILIDQLIEQSLVIDCSNNHEFNSTKYKLIHSKN